MKLSFPTRPELEARLAKRPALRPDSYSQAERLATGNGFDLKVTAADGTSVLARFNGNPGTWDLHTDSPHFADGERVRLPEAIIARLNRAMSVDGLVIRRDWRAKRHVLQVGKGTVLPILNRASVTAAGPNLIAARAPQAAAQAAPAVQAAPTPAPKVQAEPALPEAPAPSVLPAAPQVKHAPSTIAGSVPSEYRDQRVVLSAENEKRWDMARAAIKAGAPHRVILMSGPSGAGKTHAVYHLAGREGLEVVKFDASGVVEPSDWFGIMTLEKDGTKFQPSTLLQAVMTPGKRVLLIDEANRANGRAMNALLPILDGSGSFTVPQTGRSESVNPECQIVWTANIGAEHINVEPIDEAVRTRLGYTIEVDHLSEADEKALLLERVPGLTDYDAGNLARLGALLRESSLTGAHPPISTREVQAAAWAMAQKGADPRIAVDSTITDTFSPVGGDASERAAVRPHVAGIVWKQPRARKVSSTLPECGTPVDLGRTASQRVRPHALPIMA